MLLYTIATKPTCNIYIHNRYSSSTQVYFLGNKRPFTFSIHSFAGLKSYFHTWVLNIKYFLIRKKINSFKDFVFARKKLSN